MDAYKQWQLEDDKINRDLHARKKRNAERRELVQIIERFILNLDVDWKKFHRLLKVRDDCCNHVCEDDCDCGPGEPCNYDFSECHRILRDMGLDLAVIEAACLFYFPE